MRKLPGIILSLCLFAVIASAYAPYNSPIIDGVIGTDWDSDENILSDPPDDSPWGGNELRELWLTWDADNLYIGVQFSVAGNGITVYIDADDGGTVSFRDEDGWEGAWRRDVTSDREIDIFMGGWDGSPLNVYRAGETNSTDISGFSESATGAGLEAEVRIPWNQIYPTGMPVGAELAVAVLLVGGDDYFAADAMPDQPTVGDGEGPDNLGNFQIVAVDADSNGVPDFSGTYIAGNVIFSDIVSPPYPIATIIPSEGPIVQSSSEDGGWQLYGYSIGDTIAEIAFSAAGYRGGYLHGIPVTDPQNDTLEVILDAFTGAISGSVHPATECSLRAIFTNPADSGQYSITTVADGDGNFVLGHLAGAFWSVTAYPFSPDYSATTVESVLVSEPDTTEIEISLQAASILREWTDAVGDDYGPGSYTYPTEPVFVDGAFDIIAVRIKDYEDAGEIEFEIEMGNLPPTEVVNWAPYYPPLNLQKLDIYIDTHGGGSSQGLPNRSANFVPTDYWDFAISADGWWVGMFASNGQSIFDGYTRNVTDVTMTADTSANTVSIRVAKSAFRDHLGDVNWEEFDTWDFIVLSHGHDGDGVEGVRWVNAGSASQWQFGGGAEGDIDPNTLDMSVSAGIDPGTGDPKEPAEPQEIQLDWTITTPVKLAAHLAQDVTPPTIDYDINRELVHLYGTEHLLIRAEITDDIAVEKAWIHFRTTAGWDSTAMGITDDKSTWFGDIPVTGRLEDTDIPDSLEFYFTAVDAALNRVIFPNDGDSTAPDYPFAVHSDNPARVIPAPLTSDSLRICLPQNTDTLIFDFPTGDIIRVARADLNITGQVCARIEYPYLDPPESDLARLSNVRRKVEIEGANIEVPMILRIHWLAERTFEFDSNKLTLCEFSQAISPRPYGGIYYEEGSIIIGEAFRGTGFWGVGEDTRDVQTEGTLRNIRFSPNPFSPNGDGVYDRVAITWESDFEGSMDIDIYDINGRFIKQLHRNSSFAAGKSPTVWWDGKDRDGNVSGAGIYAVRFEYTYIGNEGVQLRTRTNKPIVIIK